jgi:hypothetical protein
MGALTPARHLPLEIHGYDAGFDSVVEDLTIPFN